VRFQAFLTLATLLAVPAFALQLPAGTPIQIRLQSKVGSSASRPNDPVEAIVIAPVMAGNVYAIPAGGAVHGIVTQAQPCDGEQRALLVLQFQTVDVGGVPASVAARVAAVDNAREKVDEQGRIVGVLASDTSAGKIDAEVNKIADKLGGLGSLLSSATKAVTRRVDQEITYEAGVELTLSLTAPAVLESPGGPGPLGKLTAVSDRAGLAAFAAGQPFQTMAEKPPKNSDLTNLMLIGDREEIEQAFAAAGWHAASSLNPVAKFETIEALAEDRGYSEAPVSVLLLEGRPPDLVFEKLNNTFARRHHLRIWQRPGAWQGRPVWVVAATHDMGISFSPATCNFIHRIDSSIDREREKVLDDLVLTGRVVSILMVDRAAIPKNAQNATGDNLVTDGKMAVLVFK
jgi:hypothetical protein